MGGLTLRKRTAGQPLTDAEHEERRRAAQARWAAPTGAVGVATAAAGAAGVRAGLRRHLAAIHADVKRAYGASITPEMQRTARKQALIRLNALRAQAHVQAHWPIPAMRAALYQDKRDAQRGINALTPLIDEHEAHRALVLESLKDQPELDPQHQAALRQDDRVRSRTPGAQAEPIADFSPIHDKAAAQARIDALKDAAKTRRVPRKGYEFSRGESERRVRIGQELRPTRVADAKAIEEANAANPDELHELKIPKHWYRGIYKTVKVKAHSGSVDQHKTTIPGTHNAKQLRGMRAELAGRIRGLEVAHAEKEEARHAAAHAAAKQIFRHDAAAALRWLPNRKLRLAAIGAGAVAGGLAGVFAAHGVHRVSDGLAKAADDTTGDLPDAGTHLSDAVDSAEPKLAEAIARVFRQWKDDAAVNLRTPRESTLYSTMLTDLDRATRPLEPVLKAGTNAPVQAIAPDEDGKHRMITVTMGARGPDVEDFIANYRQNRIVELANEQKAAIRDLLIGAAREGASPDAMAKQIRQTIGLTATQAQNVLNYRRDLAQLNPGVLERGLRDKRYDGAISRAIEAKKPLTEKQIDAAVDAYHRKYLAYRAMTIARTEGVGAANNAHIATMREWLSKNPGYTVIKTWNAKLDEHTRPDHKALHGESVVGLDTPFTCKSGEQIRWPHDPQAAAKEVINCRCFPQLRIVPRSRAARMGTKAVRPFADEIKPVERAA